MKNVMEDSLRHECYRTSGRVGLISFLDASDIIVIGVGFYISSYVADTISEIAPLNFLIMIAGTVASWFVNFAVKKRLEPYPRFVEYFFNWWFNGIDHYKSDVDENPVPLIITDDMKMGHSMKKVEKEIGKKSKNVKSFKKEKKISVK